MRPRFSILVPAHNEERFIGACLEAIRVASVHFAGRVEVIVILNRCSDRTEEIAASFGARTVREDARNLSTIRNAGARAAEGDIIVTIDADSAMSAGTLTAIDRALAGGATVGGGVAIRPDRVSIGIRATALVLRIWTFAGRFSGGLFWCTREDFHAVGGFNEELVSGEDIDFAKRLKAYGKAAGRPFTTLRGGHIVTSCRKFDAYGDWCGVTHPVLFWRLLHGRHRPAADEFFYDFEH
jgi:glycosyltransferase involved in cell wall biosynthesis